MDELRKKLGARIKQIRSELGLKQVELAQRLGVKGPSVSAYETGDSEMSYDSLVLLSKLSGKSIDWLITGEGSFVVSEQQPEYTATMPVRAMAGAGHPHCIDQLEPIGHITLDKSYDGPNIQVLQIRGNSMEPTIMDNSHVGIDVTDKEVISGQMYAVFIPYEGIVVKRIWIGPETVRIASDNPTAPDHELLTERINWETFVQGRVKWTVQRY